MVKRTERRDVESGSEAVQVETCGADLPIRPQNEAKMHKTQKSHLQLVPETPIYPAIKGAVAGPAKGANPNLSIRPPSQKYQP